LAWQDDPLPSIKNYLGEAETETPSLNEPYPLATWARASGFDEAVLGRWVRAVERKRQAILYGPPGTGKTFMAERLARHLLGLDDRDGFKDLVQFHPSYAYEDFMQGIRPVVGPTGGLSYEVSSGRFLEFCRRATEHKGRC